MKLPGLARSILKFKYKGFKGKGFGLEWKDSSSVVALWQSEQTKIMIYFLLVSVHTDGKSLPTRHKTCVPLCCWCILCCIKTEVRESRRKGPEDSSMEKVSWLFLCLGDNNTGATGNLSKRGFWALFIPDTKPCRWPRTLPMEPIWL